MLNFYEKIIEKEHTFVILYNKILIKMKACVMMNFNAYDLVSHLVPGYLIVFYFRNWLGIELKDIGSLAIVAIAFALGFFVQTLASWFEDVLFFTWGGKPSTMLLKGKQIWKVRFHSWKDARESLILETSENSNEDQMFEVAQRVVNAKKLDRVGSFNALYAFTRVMVITFLLILISRFFEKVINWKEIVIFSLLIIITWVRAKQRGYYFAREVLSGYLNEKVKKTGGEINA